jgi:EAL domain-containing protein (putative c-di-GMP-specific phosphodiesterase class I)
MSGFTELVAPASPAASDAVIQKSLAVLRSHLGMEVAFVGRFDDGRRWFDYVDAAADFCPVQPGTSDAREDSYCARVVDGRLPELVRDASLEPAVADLAVTWELPVGAHLSVPLRRASGDVLGTLCCFSREPDPDLRERDVKTMRMFADMVSTHLESLVEQEDIVRETRKRVSEVLAGGGPRMAMQPIVHVASGHVYGYEALARFPGHLDWAPDRWFAEATDVGLGAELEASAIRSALEALSRIPPTATMSVNVSARVLPQDEVVELLTGVHAGRLVVELTEHSRIDSYDSLADHLGAIRAAGGRIAVDDAGSGYAGLEHILELQPDVLKLDRFLVHGVATHPGRQAMVESLVGFARRVGAAVVAEGVETATDLQALADLEVTYAQGYHLGRPSLEFTDRG